MVQQPTAISDMVTPPVSEQPEPPQAPTPEQVQQPMTPETQHTMAPPAQPPPAAQDNSGSASKPLIATLAPVEVVEVVEAAETAAAHSGGLVVGGAFADSDVPEGPSAENGMEEKAEPVSDSQGAPGTAAGQAASSDDVTSPKAATPEAHAHISNEQLGDTAPLSHAESESVVQPHSEIYHEPASASADVYSDGVNDVTSGLEAAKRVTEPAPAIAADGTSTPGSVLQQALDGPAGGPAHDKAREPPAGGSEARAPDQAVLPPPALPEQATVEKEAADVKPAAAVAASSAEEEDVTIAAAADADAAPQPGTSPVIGSLPSPSPEPAAVTDSTGAGIGAPDTTGGAVDSLLSDLLGPEDGNTELHGTGNSTDNSKAGPEMTLLVADTVTELGAVAAGSGDVVDADLFSGLQVPQ